MIPINDEAELAEQDKLGFIGHPFQRAKRRRQLPKPRGRDAVDTGALIRGADVHPDIARPRFPGLLLARLISQGLPDLLPPRARGSRAADADVSLRHMTLESWAKAVLQERPVASRPPKQP